MRLDRMTSPLVSGGLIAGLTVVGLAVVQFLGRRALRFARSIQNIREARRQQLVTLIQIADQRHPCARGYRDALPAPGGLGARPGA